VHLQRGLGGLGWPLAPERVDQPLAGDDLVRVQEQRAQQAPLLLPRKRERPTVFDHFERA